MNEAIEIFCVETQWPEPGCECPQTQVIAIGPGYPAGVAYVNHHSWGAHLSFVIVADHFRREGIATRLLEYCCNRWRDIDLGSAISEGGEGLLDSLERDTAEAAR